MKRTFAEWLAQKLLIAVLIGCGLIVPLISRFWDDIARFLGFGN